VPVISFRAIEAIRGGANSKDATQHEAENKGTYDGEDGHGQHFRYPRERPSSSTLT